MIKFKLLSIFIIAATISCNLNDLNNPIQNINSFKEDSTKFSDYLKKGDSVYATKIDYYSFSNSMILFDSALQYSYKTRDSTLIAEAIFAKGRVYDAWNKEPEKTVSFFIDAANILKKYPDKYERYLYLRTLIIHAYGKNKDSINCIKSINELLIEAKNIPVEERIKYPYFAEILLSSANMNKFDLTEKILITLPEIKTVKNDSTKINFRNHYIMAQSKLDIYYRKIKQSKYLDTLIQIYNNTTTPHDSIFYSNEIYLQFIEIKDYANAYKYLSLNKEISLKTFSINGVASMKNVLLQADLNNINRQREIEKKQSKSKNILLSIMALFTVIISYLSYILFKKNKHELIKTNIISEKNILLNERNIQNDILNKEIHHRIKNNLQMIFSLLSMQERNSNNTQVIEQLQIARMRVESIATLHEQLIHIKNEEPIEFKKHINEIINKAIDTMSSYKTVIANINIDNINLNHNKSFALSLILNEWITNSIKYAKSKSNRLELNINIFIKEKNVIINYFDNGIESETKTNLGIGNQIVSLLCKQLKGSLQINNFYNYKLIFPNEK